MICIILETLVVKGLFTAGHWLAAHGTSGLAAKGGAMLAKSVAVNGLGSTASAVAGGAIVTGFVVGGVTLTTSSLRLLGEAIRDLSEGKSIEAIKKFAIFYGKLHVDIDLFPDVLELDILPRIGFSKADASAVASFVRNAEDDILHFSKLS